MALIHADFVEETTTTTGTGTLDLAGATTGHRTFVAAIGTGNTCIYAIASSDGNFESGVGTITDGTPDTLARTTLLSSSTGSKLDLPAGTHNVYCTFAAEGGTKAYNAQPTGGGVWFGDSAPSDLVTYPLWFDTRDPASTVGGLTMYVYFTDADSSQWVPISAFLNSGLTAAQSNALTACTAMAAAQFGAL